MTLLGRLVTVECLVEKSADDQADTKCVDLPSQRTFVVSPRSGSAIQRTGVASDLDAGRQTGSSAVLGRVKEALAMLQSLSREPTAIKLRCAYAGAYRGE